jgi:hypothetical protein
MHPRLLGDPVQDVVEHLEALGPATWGLTPRVALADESVTRAPDVQRLSPGHVVRTTNLSVFRRHPPRAAVISACCGILESAALQGDRVFAPYGVNAVVGVDLS